MSYCELMEARIEDYAAGTQEGIQGIAQADKRQKRDIDSLPNCGGEEYDDEGHVMDKICILQEQVYELQRVIGSIQMAVKQSQYCSLMN